MQLISLSKGKSVLVDDRDYEFFSQFKWCFRGGEDDDHGYAVRHKKTDGKDRLAYLHREIMQPPPGHEVIFLNHDRLDCRRVNLMVATTVEARRHHQVRRDSESGIKCVRYDAASDMWIAYSVRNRTCYKLGRFGSDEEAEAAHQQAMRSENAALHNAPGVVDRSKIQPPVNAEQ